MPLVYDDPWWLEQAQRSWSLAGVPFRLGLWLSGGLPWGPHAIVLLLHLLNGALVWRLARRWLVPIGALLTLTVFWLHPLPLQAVFYVTGGREVWLTTWVLVAVLGGLSRSLVKRLIGIAALIAGVTIKASALPIILVVPLAWAVARGYWRVMAFALMLLGLAGSAPWVWNREALRIWATSLMRYALMVIWPSGFSLIHDWSVAPRALISLAMGLVIGAGILAWDRRGAAWYAWLWIMGLTLPRALIRDAPPLTEAQTYLPFVALWLAIGAGLDALLKGPTWLTKHSMHPIHP